MHPFTTEMLSAEVPDFACLSVQLSVQAGAKAGAAQATPRGGAGHRPPTLWRAAHGWGSLWRAANPAGEATRRPAVASTHHADFALDRAADALGTADLGSERPVALWDLVFSSPELDLQPL